MVTIKVLQRNDASSIVIAIALAMIGAGVITAWSTSLTDALVQDGIGDRSPGFSEGYFVPALIFVLQLMLLELTLRAIIYARSAYLKSQ